MNFVLLFTLIISAAFGQSRPVGKPNDGILIDGECLPQEGEGYMQLFRETERIWGTQPMISMLKETASDISRRYPGRDRLQVEDISAKEGGDIDGHGSHENGLDVDIGYFKANGIEHDPKKTGQTYAPSMVEGNRPSANFDVERNWELMKALHRHGKVQKIFMDDVLKKELCNYAKSKKDYASNISVFRSIRHETNHADHIHVRLRCPATAKKCINLPDPPPGSGCP